MKRSILFLALAALATATFAYAECPEPVDTVTVQQIQLGMGVIVNEIYYVDSIVVTGLGEAGFYAQELEDTGSAFSGIYVYTGAEPTDYSRGDLVNVIGTLQEYFEWTELRVTSDYYGCVFIIGTADVPVPAMVTCCDINDSVNVEAEKWESVLVQVDSVRVTNDNYSQYGEWTVVEFDGDAGCAAQETLICDDEMLQPVAVPDSGTHLQGIIGCISYNFDFFKLNPRNNADLLYIGLPPAPNTRFCYPIDNSHLGVAFDKQLDEVSAENASNYYIAEFDITISSAQMQDDSLTVILTTSDMSGFTGSAFRSLVVENVKNAQGVPMAANIEEFIPGVKNCEFAHLTDSATVAGRPFAIGAVVTATPTEAYADRYMFIQDRNTAFGYGLILYTGSYIDVDEVGIERGDSVLVSGLVSPYFGLIEMGVVDYIGIVTPGLAVPAPVVVSVATARTDPYEGKLVRVENVRVRTDSIGWGEWSVDNVLGDTLCIDNIFSPGIDNYEPAPGDSFTFIAGPMWYEYSHRKINPRDYDDIYIVGVTDVDDGAPKFMNALDQNRPNPFNPVTTIQFSLQRPTDVALRIYDVSGREVRTLTKSNLQAGRYEAVWHGQNNAGQNVSSGVYFYRLEAGEYTATRKMVLIR
ncbi:MAG: T9SS type A sorting domain-containing protein [Candidatus Eisenbacteria bacterium]|nr:T9SS type A sorting domain-containing protein [Candidatus Eisenbacteria bacterium]